MRAAPSLAEVGSYLIAPLNVTLSGGAEPEALPRIGQLPAHFGKCSQRWGAALFPPRIDSECPPSC
jgi:hypothetical protein